MTREEFFGLVEKPLKTKGVELMQTPKMTYEYFIDRLMEAKEEGWEKALATFKDDVNEGMIERLPSEWDDEGFKYFDPYKNDFCEEIGF